MGKRSHRPMPTDARELARAMFRGARRRLEMKKQKQGVGRVRVPGTQVRQPIRGTGRRRGQHSAEPFLDHGAQRPTEPPGVALRPNQKIVMNVQCRLHDSHTTHKGGYGIAGSPRTTNAGNCPAEEPRRRESQSEPSWRFSAAVTPHDGSWGWSAGQAPRSTVARAVRTTRPTRGGGRPRAARHRARPPSGRGGRVGAPGRLRASGMGGSPRTPSG